MTKRVGFSLIEIIVATTIIIIFSGITLAQYGLFIEQNKLKEEASKFREVLELAKKKTIVRDISSCLGNFEGYKINIINSKSYQLALCCDGNCDSIIQTYTFQSKANKINFVNSPSEIQFIPVSTGVNVTSDIDILLKNTAITNTKQCMKISINKTGIINAENSFIICQ